MPDVVFDLRKISLDGAGYTTLAGINNNQHRLTDNFINIAFQDSAAGGPSENIARLLQIARQVHAQNLSRLASLEGSATEYNYCTILCRRSDQPDSEAFPIINAIEGIARSSSGEIVADAGFVGLIFASHLRDAYRDHLDHGAPRDGEIESILNILAVAPFPILGLPKPLFMIARRSDQENSPEPTRTEAFFNSLGMSCLPYQAFTRSLHERGPLFRYLSFEAAPRTLVTPGGDVSPSLYGFTPGQTAMVTAIGWPLFACIQTQLYDHTRWPDIPLYDHKIRLDHTGLQTRKALDWLAGPGMHEAILNLGAQIRAADAVGGAD